MSTSQLNVKDFILKILTGMSIGIVVALVPGALLNEICKAIGLTSVLTITSMAAKLLGVVMGLCIAMQFKFTPIQSGTLAVATMIGGGAIRMTEAGLVLGGVGDVINAGLTAAIAVALILLIGNRLKAYTILLVPTIVILISGFIGMQTLPYVAKVTGAMGSLVAMFATLQPVIAGMLIAVTFAFLIVSPISTVGVALAISLAGIGSGAANLGICAAGFGLAIAGFKENGVGTSIAHFLGSPKMQMANFVKKPKMLIPILANAAIVGALGGAFGIQGTPMSAGFGFSGLIGPLNHLNLVGFSVGNVLITIGLFVVVPVILGFLFKFVFIDKLNVVKTDDYSIKF